MEQNTAKESVEPDFIYMIKKSTELIVMDRLKKAFTALAELVEDWEHNPRPKTAEDEKKKDELIATLAWLDKYEAREDIKSMREEERTRYASKKLDEYGKKKERFIAAALACLDGYEAREAREEAEGSEADEAHEANRFEGREEEDVTSDDIPGSHILNGEQESKRMQPKLDYSSEGSDVTKEQNRSSSSTVEELASPTPLTTAALQKHDEARAPIPSVVEEVSKLAVHSSSECSSDYWDQLRAERSRRESSNEDDK